jgi:hypothetical protein
MKKLTKKDFVDRSNKIHNNKYDYSKFIYSNIRTKSIIICNIHGEFSQIPGDHLYGSICPKCANIIRGNKIRKSQNCFINKARKIHNNKYDYSLVNYIGTKIKIKIICKSHGIFYQTPNSHLNGVGCLKCGIDKNSLSQRKSITDFIKESINIHGNKYNYKKFKYINTHTKSKIICKIHGSFLQSAHDHLDSMGCPKCNLSKGEQKIICFLDNNRIKYTSQKTFDDCRNPKTNHKLPFDFYIPSKNLLIEYDGQCHYTFGRKLGNFTTTKLDLKNTKYRDKIKTKYAKENNIKLLRIKYTKFNKINKILTYKLLR